MDRLKQPLSLSRLTPPAQHNTVAAVLCHARGGGVRRQPVGGISAAGWLAGRGFVKETNVSCGDMDTVKEGASLVGSVVDQKAE